MKKKTFLRLLATLSLSAALVGCGNSGGSSDSNELYIFNTKSEIGEGLEQLAKDYEAEIQKLTDSFSKKVDELLARKEHDILTV